MKRLIGCAAVVLAALTASAAAQDKTLDPNKLTVEAKRPPLQLNDKQRAVIQSALASENTQQKTPKNFQPQVGAKVPLGMKVDVMPERLVQREPSLQPYGYAKLAKQLLVIDPMKKTIIAVLARQSPASGKAEKPADWAATKGRELTGQAPEPAANKQAPEPAGDSGDVNNGNEQNASQK